MVETSAGTVAVGRVRTPLGTFGAAVTPLGLCRLTFPHEPEDACAEWVRRWLLGVVVAEDAALAPLTEQLNAYLDGQLREFSVPVDLRGTPFQLEVWWALMAIPYGHARSYAALAAAIGRPKAVRAVGLANGANPVPIVVPCHRVIGNDGTLTGYGGGLALKQHLLRLERVPGFADSVQQLRLLTD